MILSGFDDDITTTQEEAEAALEDVDKIQAKIDEANNITDRAKQTLGEAKRVAIQANEKGQQAADIAEDVQKVIGAFDIFKS